MKDTLTRGLRFLARHIGRNNRFLFTYAWHFFDEDFICAPQFYTEEELLAQISAGKSLIRFGDGEIALMNFGEVGLYEKYHPRLRAYLIAAIKNYSTESPYLIGIPQQYIGMKNKDLRRINLFHCWLPLKATYQNIFPKHVRYFDAHQFYRGNSFERLLEGILKDRLVIVVTSKSNIALMREAGMDKRLRVSFIETRDRDTFTIFDEVLHQIQARVTDKEQTRVLLSTGPASKALAYELSKSGIVCYDLGKGIETVYRENTIEELI